jgi:hypothetical protein
MPRTSKKDTQTLDLLQARTSTAPCVPAIREAVKEWCAKGYPGITPTSKTLLNFWFHTDHRLRGNVPFAFNRAQQEAIETLVYLWEIARIRRVSQLIESYCVRQDLKLLQHDDFARLGVKMATGSGKTFVMALMALYHYFNASLESHVEGGDWCKTSLLLAPNVIVYERLQSDFEGGKFWKTFPMVPPELQAFFDFAVYTRGQSERATSKGALYLTNIQQLYTRPEAHDAQTDPIAALMGALPTQSGDGEARSFKNRIIERARENGSPLLVLNDEAHHTHDEKLGWNEVIRELGEATGGLGAQLDFSATPRHSKGNLFAWTITDYPLKQAIIDGLVKTPVKGTTSGIKEQQSDIASVRYAPYLIAGVQRWKEYRDELAPLGKKPILFVMLNDTKEADDVGDFLKTKFPSEFGGDKLLVIHTNGSGEIQKGDLERARELARTVDRPDNPVSCIVSVLMLREGWDCLDSETEILTPQGWKGQGEVTIGDEVYSFNLETEKMEVVKVLDSGERPVREGERMVRLQSQHLDVRTTEGHLFHLKYWNGREKRVSPNMIVRTGMELAERRSDYVLPLSAECAEPFSGLPLSDDELRFVAWFMTDGGFSGQSRRQLSIVQSSVKPYHHDIRSLLGRLEMDSREYALLPGKTSYTNSQPFFRFDVPKGTHTRTLARNGWHRLGKYLDKDVAPALHAMTREQFRVFWDELLKGDGERSSPNRSGWLWCDRKEQANAYTHMAVVRGFAASYHEEITDAGRTVYRLSVRDTQWLQSRPSDPRATRITLETPHPNEMVWCISNRNGTLVSRRRGKIAIIGNCTSVVVVVGLRPYSSKANILPEQAIGRGLRLMFRGNSGFKERVDIIGNGKFLEFVEDLEREEDIQFDKFEIGKDKVTIQQIVPDLSKLAFDIEVPQLSPALERKTSLELEILALEPRTFKCQALPRNEADLEAQTFVYEGVDILTREKLFEREYQIPQAQTAEEVIGFYAKRIMQDVKLPSQFSVVAPKVREFLTHKAFGETVDLADPALIKAIQHRLVAFVTISQFSKALRERVVEAVEPGIVGEPRRISQTPAFPWSRPLANAQKCVLNRVPCDNEFERRFALFLELAPDVARFSKLASHFGFSIKYTDAGANLRNYEPDFVAVDSEGTHWILETKGQEDIHVAHKDRAAQLWCENATALTDTNWRYLIAKQKAYEELAPESFVDLKLGLG